MQNCSTTSLTVGLHIAIWLPDMQALISTESRHWLHGNPALSCWVLRLMNVRVNSSDCSDYIKILPASRQMLLIHLLLGLCIWLRKHHSWLLCLLALFKAARMAFRASSLRLASQNMAGRPCGNMQHEHI